MTAKELTGTFAGYRIESTLGNRMEAAYYLAEHDLHGRVTLVVLHEEACRSAAVVERYRELTRARSGLEHPAIAHVLEAGEEEDKLFLVYDREVAGTLVDLLESAEALEPEEALPLVRQVLGALEHAHGARQVRGELKPRHVLVGPGRKAYVTGFGAGTNSGDEGGGDRAARLQQIMDRLDVYLAPEHVLHPEKVDARADVYAAGMILYRMVTGMVPFEAETREELAEQVLAGPPYVPSSVRSSVSRELDRVILKAIEKAPENRIQSASYMKAALEMAAQGERTGLELVGPVRYHEWPWSLRMVLLVLILQVAYLVVYDPDRLRQWGAVIRSVLGA